jgi:hypothetical protein
MYLLCMYVCMYACGWILTHPLKTGNFPRHCDIVHKKIFIKTATLSCQNRLPFVLAYVVFI